MDSDMLKIYGALLKSRSGVALMVTLWVLVFLIIIVSEFSYVTRIELKTSKNVKDETQAYFLALAGVEAAIHELMGDYSFQYLDQEGNLVFAPGRDSDYAGSGQGDTIIMSSPQRTNIVLDTGTFSYQIIDQERKFNINSIRNANPAPTTPYSKFRSILLQSGVETGIPLDTIADSVIDWLDKDDLHGLNGAESDWYEDNYESMGFTEPYKAKNGRFDTVEELLMVRGITPEILYGTRRAAEMGLLEEREDSVEDEDATYRGFYDYICVSPHSSSRININTISEELLSILFPGAAGEVITTREANGGIYPRSSRSSELRSTTNRSYTFLIESTGRVYNSELTRTIKCIVWKRGAGANSRLTYQYWNDISPMSEVNTDPSPPEAEEES